VALGVHGFRFPGVASLTYVLVTVVLSMVIWHQEVAAPKVGGILIVLAGVALLTLRVHV
jgi:multidrug transporter EmrE-like cation transporter